MHQNQSQALQKFKRNYWGVFALIFIGINILLAIFAYCFVPDYSENANNGDIALAGKSPGFQVNMIVIQNRNHRDFKSYFSGQKVPNTLISIQSHTIKGDTIFYKAFSNLKTNVETKYIVKSQYAHQNIQIVPKTYYLGTDNQGRDYLSRLIVGSRVSLSIGFVAVIISVIIGVLFGAIAGYFGGKTDAIILWIINVVWSIPTLLLVIAITLALGKGFWQVFIAVGLTMWVEVARVVRGQVMSVKEMPYITAARALGFSDWRILFKHVLPNAIAPVIVISAANFASAILVESGLSFLGLGAQIPVPSWGGMIKEHYNYILLGKAYLALLPGLAMSALVVAFMILGNALRDALDVRD